MAAKFYVVSTRNPEHRFEIVKLDKATLTATLKGTGSATPFTRSITQAELDKYSYRIERVEEQTA